MRRLLLAILVLFSWRRRRREKKERIVPEGSPNRGAENVVMLFFLLAAALAIMFVVIYATSSWQGHTQLLGIALGGSFACVAVALIVMSKTLIVSEELEEEYPQLEHPEERQAIVQIVEESGDRLTRKRLFRLAAGSAGGAIGVALLAPVVSLGPIFNLDPLYRTPWRRGRRLVDDSGRPMRADDIEPDTFYTAFPEHGPKEQIASPVVVIRLSPDALRLPRGREGWAPQGILAYSKICTHAGCAIALYRTPLFEPTQPKPALVCPCHYSTFDPADGGTVLFGPAGRPLPQLPLLIDQRGDLRAGGNFSGPVGPSWWGVRLRGPE